MKLVPFSLFIAGLALSNLSAAQQAPFIDNSELRRIPGFEALNAGEREHKRTAEILAQQQLQANIPPEADVRVINLDAQRFAVSSIDTPRANQSDAVYDAPTNPSAVPPMPNARPGECFALVNTPAVYRERDREVEISPATERLEPVPARYEDVQETYVKQEAYERVEVIPATFKDVPETVQVQPETTRYETIEPQYVEATNRILVQPARKIWKVGTGPNQRVDPTTGQIMCLVEEPAVYQKVNRRVLKQAAQLREVRIPAQTAVVMRRVMDRPSETRRYVVPAQMATRTVRRLVEPATVRRAMMPAKTGITKVRDLVAPSRLEWRSVLCQTNMTPDVIRRVQASLANAGYKPGSINGRMSAETIGALNQYQRARNLPEDNYLNMQTARALGVAQ